MAKERSSRLLTPDERVEAKRQARRDMPLLAAQAQAQGGRMIADLAGMFGGAVAADIPAGINALGAGYFEGTSLGGPVGSTVKGIRRDQEALNPYGGPKTDEAQMLLEEVAGGFRSLTETQIGEHTLGEWAGSAEDSIVARLGQVHPSLAGLAAATFVGAIEVVDPLHGTGRMGRVSPRLLRDREGSLGNLQSLDHWVESSLDKQAAIGSTYQHMVDGTPEYKEAVFNDWNKKFPEIIKRTGAQDYDDLVVAAYDELKEEIVKQYDEMIDSGIKVEWDATGERAYSSSKALSDDVRDNNRIVVFQGGEKHDLLGKISDKHGVSYNDMLRTVHDYRGHVRPETTFGPIGEERAWFAHSNELSPLAKAALTTETRGQNSWVNYSTANLPLKRALKDIEIQAVKDGRGPKVGGEGTVQYTDEEQKLRQYLLSHTKYAPQRAGLLPAGMSRQDYVRGTLNELEILGNPTEGMRRGYHYLPDSAGPQKMTDPSRIGSGRLGQDRGAIESMPERLQPRTFFYTKPDAAESMIQGTQFEIEAKNVYNIDEDPEGLVELARVLNQTGARGGDPSGVNAWQMRSDMEQLMRTRGYEGAYSPKAVERGAGTPDAFVMFTPQHLFPMGETEMFHGAGAAFKPNYPEQPFGHFDDGFLGQGMDALGRGHYTTPTPAMAKAYDEGGGVLAMDMPLKNIAKTIDESIPIDDQLFVKEAIERAYKKRGLEFVPRGTNDGTVRSGQFRDDLGDGWEDALREEGIKGVSYSEDPVHTGEARIGKPGVPRVVSMFSADDMPPIKSRDGKTPGQARLQHRQIGAPSRDPKRSRVVDALLGDELPEIKGTGTNSRLVTPDVARHLQGMHAKRFRGRVLDPSDARDRGIILSGAEDEVRFQLDQPESGVGWYDEDIDASRLALARIDPRFAKESDPLYTIWSGNIASTSYGTRVPINAIEGTTAIEYYLKTGRLPEINPATGGPWSGKFNPTKSQQLELQNYLLDRFGEQGYADFMLSEHPLKDLTQLRKESGQYLGNNPKPVAGRATQPTYGAKILGPKGGSYMLNLNQIDDGTIDLWNTRTQNRRRGRLFNSKGELIDAPLNSSDALQMQDMNSRLADRVGMSQRDTQAVDWFFEQQLYDRFGARAQPGRLSEGLEEYFAKRR